MARKVAFGPSADRLCERSRPVGFRIYQITRNEIVDHYRKPGRQREIPSGLSAELEVIVEVSETSTATHHGDAGEPRAELAACLRPMIERLSQDYRNAITLVEIDGLTQQAAAEQMGL